MVLKQLYQHINTYDPIPKRGSGISIKDLRKLQDIGIIKLTKIPLKSGKTPKSYNAFELTLFGRDMIRKYVNKSISKEEILSKVHHDLTTVQNEINSLKGSLEGLENKLGMLEQYIIQFANQGEQQEMVKMTNVTEEDLQELLSLAENSATRDNRMGLLYKSEIYFDEIAKNTPFSDKTINKKLYELYEKNLLELQMGPDHGGRSVLSPSGKKFSWGKLVN